MAVQHQDPLVYNAFTSTWQNASKAGVSGQPLGISIGPPGGSIVSLQPTVGQTIQIDGAGPVGSIESALQMDSGAATENIPGYTAPIVFNLGLANEQIGHLSVSGLAQNGSGQAVIMTANSADGSILGSIYHGTIGPGTGGVTWAFTTATVLQQASGVMRVNTGYEVLATNPGSPGVNESWHSMSLTNGWSGSGRYRLTVDKRCQIQVQVTPGSAQKFSSVPVGYRAANTAYVAAGGTANVSAVESPYVKVYTNGNLEMYGFHAFGGGGIFGSSGSYAVD